MCDLSESVDFEAFRAEVRGFLQEAIPTDICRAVQARCLVTREQAKRWHRVLHARGWVAPAWPIEHGGPGWSLAQQAVFREELAVSAAPIYENLGIDTIGPTLMRNGTAVQCAHYLPRMLSFEDYWAQAYSEPDAGSDLASLRTRADRDGKHYIVNGTKIWQSQGHWANRALVLVRTDSRAAVRQAGISVLVIDLQSPGVTVRPIRFINGSLFHSQLFFDEVRVPIENLIGLENQGWDVAKGLLVTERLFAVRLAEVKAAQWETARLAAGRAGNGGSLLEQDVYARRHAELAIRTRALEAAWWPALGAAQRGDEPVLQASLLKLLGNEILQDSHQLQLDLLGDDALAFDPGAVEGIPASRPFSPGHANNLALHVWRYRGITLGGGTSEVQRNILAKAIFAGRSELDSPTSDGSEVRATLCAALRRRLSDETTEAGPRPDRGATSQNALPCARLNDLGLPGLLVPERDGGFGGNPSDLVAVMEVLGEALAPEPFLWNMVVPGLILADASNFQRRATRLRALIAGQLQLNVVGLDQAQVSHPAIAATRTASGWRLVGNQRLAIGAAQAQHLIVVVRLEGGGKALFEIDAAAAGVRLRPYDIHDGRMAAEVTLEAVDVSTDDLVAGPERSEDLIDEARVIATLALSAESAGAMQRSLALTVDYLGVRRQFGSRLADFQVLQHRVVEHYRQWIQARTLVRAAAADWNAVTQQERLLRVLAAKWMAGRAGRALGLDAIQLHGAIGLQAETSISRYAKRLAANDTLLGDSTHQLGRFIAGADFANPERQ